jgi:hypothetical protein
MKLLGSKYIPTEANSHGTRNRTVHSAEHVAIQPHQSAFTLHKERETRHSYVQFQSILLATNDLEKKMLQITLKILHMPLMRLCFWKRHEMWIITLLRIPEAAAGNQSASLLQLASSRVCSLMSLSFSSTSTVYG